MKQPHVQKATKQRKPCFRCGGDHIPQKCRFKHENCRNCNSKGHIAKVCKKKAPALRPEQNWTRQLVRYLELDDPAPNNHDDVFKLFQISEEKLEPSIIIPVNVNGEECSIELDTVHPSRSYLRRLGERDSRQLHSKSHKLDFALILEKPSTSSGKLMCKSHIKTRSPIYRFRSSKEKDQAYLDETGLRTLS